MAAIFTIIILAIGALLFLWILKLARDECRKTKGFTKRIKK